MQAQADPLACLDRLLIIGTDTSVTDGKATEAVLDGPRGLVRDAVGNLHLTDNTRIVRIAPDKQAQRLTVPAPVIAGASGSTVNAQTIKIIE